MKAKLIIILVAAALLSACAKEDFSPDRYRCPDEVKLKVKVERTEYG